MLDHLGHPDAGARAEEVVREALRQGVVTRDLGGTLGTREVGEWIRQRL
jgi:isocitrate/isopropylmalate dehydrogenase